MKIITTYEAFDGTEFSTEQECKEYEEKNGIKIVTDIALFDVNNKIYFINIDKLTDDPYIFCEKVLLKNEEELEAFNRFADACGWSEFTDAWINSPGLWERHTNEYNDPCWTCTSIEKLKR